MIVSSAYPMIGMKSGMMSTGTARLAKLGLHPLCEDALQAHPG